jgi:cell division septum initiation protein DivIVA
MSAVGQLLATVEAKVRELLTDFVQKNQEQDKRLDAVEKRLDALEAPASSSAAKRATTARASTAGASAKATGTK